MKTYKTFTIEQETLRMLDELQYLRNIRQQDKRANKSGIVDEAVAKLYEEEKKQ